MNRVFDILVLVTLGAMLADLVANPTGTKTVVDGLTGIWSASMKAVNPSANL